MILPLLLTLAAQASEVARDVVVPVPTDENRAAWVAFLTPAADEVAHESIPWLPTFGEGVLAAEERDAPLLFWAMNGHPLGCT